MCKEKGNMSNRHDLPSDRQTRKNILTNIFSIYLTSCVASQYITCQGSILSRPALMNITGELKSKKYFFAEF